MIDDIMDLWAKMPTARPRKMKAKPEGLEDIEKEERKIRETREGFKKQLSLLDEKMFFLRRRKRALKTSKKDWIKK